jgi:hypothetical protein
MPARTERRGDAFDLLLDMRAKGRTRGPGPARRVPAAPDQPAAPTPPLPGPRNDRARCHQPQTPQRRERRANNVTGNYRAGSPGCGRRRQLCADRCGRSDTPALRQRRLRGTTPRLGTAPTRAGAPLRLNLPRGSRRGWALSCRDGVRRRVASRRRPLHARVGEQRMAVDSAARERRRTRHPGLRPALSGELGPSAALTSRGGSREGGLDRASPGAPPTGIGDLLPLQRDLQLDVWIRASRAPVPPPGFRSGMRKAGNAAGQLSRLGRKGGDGC